MSGMLVSATPESWFLDSRISRWDKALQTLLIFMVVDWITGGILLPVVFGRAAGWVSGKSIIQDAG